MKGEVTKDVSDALNRGGGGDKRQNRTDRSVGVLWCVCCVALLDASSRVSA